MIKIFRNRAQAGQLLAKRLMHYAGRKDVIVLALPRGGVPVGYEIAQALQLPLDIFLVRKLGAPGHEELAFGAIAIDGATVFNHEIIEMLGLSPTVIDAVIKRETMVLNERNRKYRGSRPLPNLLDHTVILVDDGIATGATLMAAITAIRKICGQIVVAVPVAPAEAVTKFSSVTDEFICLETPRDFLAIGSWYEDFSQTSDEEVYRLLGRTTPSGTTRPAGQY